MIDLWLLPVGLLCLLYLYRADFQQYSVFTVGVFKRISRYEGHRNIECSNVDCDNTTEGSELRKAYKEIVIGGAVIAKYDVVSNRYCHKHTSFEFQQDEFGQTTTRRVAETLIGGIVGVASWKVEQKEDQTPFDEVTANMSTSFELVPVALIVLVAALLMGAVKGLSGETA